MAYVVLNAAIQMPEEELEECLKVLRKWENQREDIQMAIKIEAPTKSLKDLADIFNALEPKLPISVVLPKREI